MAAENYRMFPLETKIKQQFNLIAVKCEHVIILENDQTLTTSAVVCLSLRISIILAVRLMVKIRFNV